MSFRADDLAHLIRDRVAELAGARMREGVSEERFFGSERPLRFIEVAADGLPVTVWREDEQLTWVSMPVDLDGREFEVTTEWYGTAASLVELVVALASGQFDVVNGRLRVRIGRRLQRLELWPR